MDKLFAWISVTCLMSVMVRIHPSSLLMQTLLFVALGCCLLQSFQVTRALFSKTRERLLHFRMRWSIVSFLFRKISRLKLELAQSRSEASALDSQLKEISTKWSPLKPKYLNIPKTSRPSAGALAGLDFQEPPRPFAQADSFNESFWSDNSL